MSVSDGASGGPRSARVRKHVLLQRSHGLHCLATALALWHPVNTVFVLLITSLLVRIDLDMDTMLARTALSHRLGGCEV